LQEHTPKAPKGPLEDLDQVDLADAEGRRARVLRPEGERRHLAEESFQEATLSEYNDKRSGDTHAWYDQKSRKNFLRGPSVKIGKALLCVFVVPPKKKEEKKEQKPHIVPGKKDDQRKDPPDDDDEAKGPDKGGKRSKSDSSAPMA